MLVLELALVRKFDVLLISCCYYDTIANLFTVGGGLGINFKGGKFYKLFFIIYIEESLLLTTTKLFDFILYRIYGF